MKKILSFLLVACFSVTLFAQTIVSTTPSNKNVILEEYTGTNCQYCPDGHRVATQIMTNNPGRAWAINIHQGGFSGNNPQYKTDWGNALANQYGVNSYPAATVNRGSTWSASRSQWTSWSNQILNESSPVNAAAQGTINWETRHLTLLVEVYYTGNAAQSTNKLNVALLQNDILGPQSGSGLFPEMIIEGQYKHMHMLRDLITGQWGVDIPQTSAGTFKAFTFEYDIPPYVTYAGSPITNVPIFLDDIEIIVFVAENQKTILTGAKAELTYTNLPATNPRFTELIPLTSDCSNNALASLKIKNAGANPINSAEFTYTVAGGTPITFVWDKRAITSLTFDTIHLPYELQVNQNQILKVNLVKVNDESVTPVSRSITYKKDVSQTGDAEMKLLIKTDQYGSETRFKIYKPDGSILMQGGPFANNTIVERDFIPPVSGCYRLEVTDDYGDGISGGYVKIINSEGIEIYHGAGNFGSKLTAMVPVLLDPVYYTITASAGENGSIDPEGNQEYLEGTSAEYTFTPNQGYEVDEVLVDETPVQFQNNKYTFTAINKDYSIHVTFKSLPKYKIIASAGENGTISPAGENEYVEGESAEFTFIPDEGYEVDEVIVNDEPVEFENNSYTFAAIDKDNTIHVTFKLIEAIKDVNGVAISVAPNPVNDKLYITGLYDKLEIFSISGQLLAIAFNQSSVDVSHLTKGIFFVKIQSNGQTCTFKVIK